MVNVSFALKIDTACPFCAMRSSKMPIARYQQDYHDVRIVFKCPRCHREFVEYANKDSKGDKKVLFDLFNRHREEARKIDTAVPCLSKAENIEKQIDKILEEVEEVRSAKTVAEKLIELADVQIAAVTGQQILGAGETQRARIMVDANIKNARRGYWD